MDVQPRGHENPLRRGAGGDEPVDRRDRRLEARAGADFRVRGGRGAVHRYLDTLDAKRVQTGAPSSSIRLPLVSSLMATLAADEFFEDIPEKRHAHRLAAAEGDIGNAEIDRSAA